MCGKIVVLLRRKSTDKKHIATNGYRCWWNFFSWQLQIVRGNTIHLYCAARCSAILLFIFFPSVIFAAEDFFEFQALRMGIFFPLKSAEIIQIISRHIFSKDFFIATSPPVHRWIKISSIKFQHKKLTVGSNRRTQNWTTTLLPKNDVDNKSNHFWQKMTILFSMECCKKVWLRCQNNRVAE